MAASRKKGRRSAIEWVVSRGGVCLAVVVVILVVAAQRYQALTKAREWTPNAPACPVTTPAALAAAGISPANWSDYEGMRIGRAYGYITCNEIADHGGWGFGVTPVCQFNNPSALRVSTSKGEVYFLTRSSPATVSMEADGAPHCVLGAGAGLVN